VYIERIDRRWVVLSIASVDDLALIDLRFCRIRLSIPTPPWLEPASQRKYESRHEIGKRSAKSWVPG
jgi:hypothetical protein